MFGYLLPAFAVALVLALLLEEITLSDVAGMVARGEAVEDPELRRRHTPEGAPAEALDGQSPRDADETGHPRCRSRGNSEGPGRHRRPGPSPCRR